MACKGDLLDMLAIEHELRRLLVRADDNTEKARAALEASEEQRNDIWSQLRCNALAIREATDEVFGPVDG